MTAFLVSGSVPPQPFSKMDFRYRALLGLFLVGLIGSPDSGLAADPDTAGPWAEDLPSVLTEPTIQEHHQQPEQGVPTDTDALLGGRFREEASVAPRRASFETLPPRSPRRWRRVQQTVTAPFQSVKRKFSAAGTWLDRRGRRLYASLMSRFSQRALDPVYAHIMEMLITITDLNATYQGFKELRQAGVATQRPQLRRDIQQKRYALQLLLERLQEMREVYPEMTGELNRAAELAQSAIYNSQDLSSTPL